MEQVVAQWNLAGVRYLLVGGQAMRLLGMPRYTMDWDFWIPGRDAANLALLNRLLEEELDEPLLALGPRGENFIQTYQTQFGVMQFHLGLPGLSNFDEAWERSVRHRTEGGVTIRSLSPRDLLAAKKATGRPQDVGDIAFLEELLRAGG